MIGFAFAPNRADKILAPRPTPPATMNQATLPTIAYILKGFPRLSETFITHEIHLLEQLGLTLRIFSAKDEEEAKSHAIVEQIRATVTYLPEATSVEEGPFWQWLRANLPRFARHHWQLCQRRPKAYFQTLLYTLLELCLHFPFRQAPVFKKSMFKDFLRAGYIAQEVLAAGNIGHLHGHFCHGSTTITMLTSYLTGIPFSFTAHAKDIYLPKLNPFGLLATKIEQARFVATCTDANRVYMQQLCPQATAIHTIYHGLDTHFFAPPATPVTPPRPTILSIGRFVKKKGFPTLIRALAQLRDRGYDFTCRIIGEPGEDSAKVEALIQELALGANLVLEGAKTQDELRTAYAAASLFVLPCQIVNNGDRDGIPNVLAEAMAMGLPVVATTISGIPELVDDEVDGLLVPQKNVAALAAAVARLLDNAPLRQQLGHAARAKICRIFDAQQTTLLLRDLFVECLTSYQAAHSAPAGLVSAAPRGTATHSLETVS